MTIKVETGLNVKVSGSGFSDIPLEYEPVEDGEYVGTLARVYPWRKIVKDTKIARRDEDGQVVRDEDDKVIEDLVKDLEWYNADVVFRVNSGAYEGHAIKGSLSTHPKMQRALKNFLYSSGLIDVTVGEIGQHVGKVEVGIVVKNKTRSYKERETGMEVEVTEPYAYYFKKPSEIEDLGI